MIEVLIANDFKIQICMEDIELKEWMENISKECFYDLCFRIRNRENDKCVAFNPSIEHWRFFCGDILEIFNEDLVFHEGEYSIDGAKIEAKKLMNDFLDKDSMAKSLFGLNENSTKNEIVAKIEELVGYKRELLEI